MEATKALCVGDDMPPAMELKPKDRETNIALYTRDRLELERYQAFYVTLWIVYPKRNFVHSTRELAFPQTYSDKFAANDPRKAWN